MRLVILIANDHVLCDKRVSANVNAFATGDDDTVSNMYIFSHENMTGLGNDLSIASN